MVFTVGVGFIVILKLIGGPKQPLAEFGMTFMIPVISAPVELTGAVQEGMFPEPEDPNPIAVLEFDHVKDVPVRLLPNAGIFIVCPAQEIMELMLLTVGVG